MNKKCIRQHLFFSGRVQGVGFRYHARYISTGLGLTGWVRNHYDGRVEMEVQGTQEGIQQMIGMLDSQMRISIENIERQNIPVKSEVKFEIK